MTTLVGDPTVSSTTPAAVPVYNPPPMTRVPQGQLMTPSPQGQMTPAPHQGQQTSTVQAAISSGSGGDLLSRVSVRSDQVVTGDKCLP